MADKSVEGRAALADCLAFVACLACSGLGAALFVASNSAGLAFHGLLLLVASLVALGCVVEFSFDSLRRLPTGYMDGPIKVAAIAALIWGIAGFVVGDVIAWQLAIPALNLDLPWTSFGRLRPLHTSAVIFAFGGNVLIATSLYVVQRTCRARLPGRWAPWFVVWGYQLFLLIAGTGYLLGRPAAFSWGGRVTAHNRFLGA